MDQLRHYFRTNLGPALRVRPVNLTRIEAMLIVGYSAAAAIIGFATGLFELGLPSLVEVLILPPLLVVYPALIEELIFRGLLLPRSLAKVSGFRRFAALSVSSLVFVAWHPFNHYVIGMSDTSLFVEPGFLVIVLMLGYLCGHLYLRTQSLWPAIAIHWATTLIWNLFLGRP
jgi:predicted Abi (CAAX) family protease